MPDKSTPVAHGRAILLLALSVSPAAAESAAMHRSPRLQLPDSHTAAGKSAAFRSGPAKNYARRPKIDAACASFGEHAGVSAVSPKPTDPRRASCRLAADSRAAL